MITLNQSYTYEELLRNLQESGTQYPESTIYKKVGEAMMNDQFRCSVSDRDWIH